MAKGQLKVKKVTARKKDEKMKKATFDFSHCICNLRRQE